MTVTFKLEHADGTRADPPEVGLGVYVWNPGDAITLGADRSPRVDVRDEGDDAPAVLVVEDVAGNLERRGGRARGRTGRARARQAALKLRGEGRLQKIVEPARKRRRPCHGRAVVIVEDVSDSVEMLCTLQKKLQDPPNNELLANCGRSVSRTLAAQSITS